VPIWHKDVQFYEIKEEGKPHCWTYGSICAPGGTGGAWMMNSVVDKSVSCWSRW
jgi:Zn-dependent oligopeptidase